MLDASEGTSTALTRAFGVPRAVARVLAACAHAEQLCPDLALRDPLAARVFESLGGDSSAFCCSELRGTALRTVAVDWLVHDFYARAEPGALGVGLWSILGTRGHRLGALPWVDVDSPEVAEFRREVLPNRMGWLQLGTCLCNSAWLDAVYGKARRTLLFVLDESILPLRHDAMTRFLDDVSRQAESGSEIVIAFDANAPLRPASPLRRASALELVVPNGPHAGAVARYPRIRFVDDESYSERTRTLLASVNAVARSRHGVNAPAVAHLRLI
jgi:O-methyltransferase involved in polyketide biosynthesis